jgi:hypothetical protein
MNTNSPLASPDLLWQLGPSVQCWLRYADSFLARRVCSYLIEISCPNRAVIAGELDPVDPSETLVERLAIKATINSQTAACPIVITSYGRTLQNGAQLLIEVPGSFVPWVSMDYWDIDTRLDDRMISICKSLLSIVQVGRKIDWPVCGCLFVEGWPCKIEKRIWEEHRGIHIPLTVATSLGLQSSPSEFGFGLVDWTTFERI